MTQKRFGVICAALVLLSASAGFAQVTGDVYKWNFNEGSGRTATDDSGAFVASLGVPSAEGSAPALSSESPSGKTGDGSLAANGGLYVDDSSNPILAITEGPITIEAWFKLDGLNSSNGIAAYGQTYKMGVNDGYLVWTFYGIEDVFSAVAVSSDGAWHHAAASWEPGVGVTFFFDGKQADYKETANMPRAAIDNALFVGSETNGGSPFPGKVDRVRIHHALLTESDLDSVAASPKEDLANTLIAFNFDESALPAKSTVNGVERVGSSAAEHATVSTAPTFSPLSPTGKTDDYSLHFDGGDRVIFTDTKDILQFIDEDFTFEVWMKFSAEEQVSTRPIIFAYGVGGANGYSFSFRNAVLPKSDSSSPSGKEGDLSLDANSGLSVDDSTNPALGFIKDGSVTVELWAKTDDVSGYQDFIRYGNAFKAGLSAGKFELTFLGVEDVDADASLPADGAWHHIAYAWEPGVGVTFYLDGQEVSYKVTTNTNRDLASNLLSIGADHGSGSPFLGSIDRLRIHNAVLAASDLDSDATNPKALPTSAIVAYGFDEASAPFANQAATARPANNLSKGCTVAVTTYGIIDQYSDAVIPDDGRWHHIAAAHEMEKEFRFFVDGKLVQSIPYVDGVRFAEVYDFLIGAEAGGGNPYVGNLDRVRITRGALNEGDLDYFEPVSVGNWFLY